MSFHLLLKFSVITNEAIHWVLMQDKHLYDDDLTIWVCMRYLDCLIQKKNPKKHLLEDKLGQVHLSLDYK